MVHKGRWETTRGKYKVSTTSLGIGDIFFLHCRAITHCITDHLTWPSPSNIIIMALLECEASPASIHVCYLVAKCLPSACSKSNSNANSNPNTPNGHLDACFFKWHKIKINTKHDYSCCYSVICLLKVVAVKLMVSALLLVWGTRWHLLILAKNVFCILK